MRNELMQLQINTTPTPTHPPTANHTLPGVHNIHTACLSPTSLTSSVTTSTNHNVLSLLLFHGSWNHLPITQCLNFLSFIFTCHINLLDIDTSSTIVQVLAVEVDANDDGEDLCVEQFRTPDEMPALRLIYSDCDRPSSSANDDDDDDHRRPPKEQNVRADAGEISSYLSSKLHTESVGGGHMAPVNIGSFARAAFERAQKRVGVALYDALEGMCYPNEEMDCAVEDSLALMIPDSVGSSSGIGGVAGIGGIGGAGGAGPSVTAASASRNSPLPPPPPTPPPTPSSTTPTRTTLLASIPPPPTTTTTTTTATSTLNNTLLNEYKGPIRIFVAGDSTHVGKSSVCLGILGTLLHKLCYPPDTLAYVKPATQCEERQLVTSFCRHHDIDTLDDGETPLVYHKGFTRAFLKGDTETSEELLERIGVVTDCLFDCTPDVAKYGGKQVVVVDGVGYPSVGSITGTDNADVARACGYPATTTTATTDGVVGKTTTRLPPGVVLVGRSGVGNAIDAYNLNATYFRSKGVPVLGVVFNRLKEDGYYSLDLCREAITRYFENKKAHCGSDNGTKVNEEKVYGFVPEVKAIANTRIEGCNNNKDDDKDDKENVMMQAADEFINVFASHVDVKGIVESAARIANKTAPLPKFVSSGVSPTVNGKERSVAACETDVPMENAEFVSPVTAMEVEESTKTVSAMVLEDISMEVRNDVQKRTKDKVEGDPQILDEGKKPMKKLMSSMAKSREEIERMAEEQGALGGG